jgi:N utilization substance protein A
MEVIVPDEYLSIAIGKKGQNVRLASKLSGWHLDVKNETRYSQAMQIGYDSLVALPGVGIGLADALYESGFYSAEEISQATIEDLIQIRGIGEDKAEKLLEAASNAIAQAEEEADDETYAETEANNDLGEEETGRQSAEDETAEPEESLQSESPPNDETHAETEMKNDLGEEGNAPQSAEDGSNDIEESPQSEPPPNEAESDKKID